MSTAYHSQSDDQTERVNQCLEGYLRCLCSTKPTEWTRWVHNTMWKDYVVVYG